jgi:hypothetical protein
VVRAECRDPAVYWMYVSEARHDINIEKKKKNVS